MASYHHQAHFQSDTQSEYFDPVRVDTVVTKIKVLFVTTDLETMMKAEETYYIDIPPPGDNFIPYQFVDYHVLRKWASMYGDAIYYQNVNVGKINDSIKAEKSRNILNA